MWTLLVVTRMLAIFPASGPIVFNLPGDDDTRTRIVQASSWIQRHIIRVSLPNREPVSVVAWKDPTLDPQKTEQLVGYLITDTLWSGYALKLTAPDKSRELLEGLRELGWTKNKLHEVLFEPVDRLSHKPADEDFVHGRSLGIFPTANGSSVDLRVFSHQWNADYDVGHPLLFAEHAVYRALNDWWMGNIEIARMRLRPIFALDKKQEVDGIFWDDSARVVVDHVNRTHWLRWRKGDSQTIEHYSFKGALLLYAAQLLGLDREFPCIQAHMKERLWSAQNDDGGIAHFVRIDRAGNTIRAPDATGEASAIAILAETVGVKIHNTHPNDR